MLLPDKTRQHLITALSATPLVLEKLVALRASNDAAWDRQVPDRFTPREHVAHVAEWEDVFWARVQMAATGAEGLAPNPDETQMAIDLGFASSVPSEQVAVFAERRARLVKFLRQVEGNTWDGGVHHPQLGVMTLEAVAVHILSHDGYHLEFLAQHL